MSAISDLRAATRAAALAIKADASNLSPTQVNALNKVVADIDAEAALPTAANIRLPESVASGLPYQLRTSLEATPVVTSALTDTVANGQAYSYFITASHSPDTFYANNLPAGLTLDPDTGEISGTAPAANVYNIGIGGINSGGTGAESTLVLTVT